MNFVYLIVEDVTYYVQFSSENFKIFLNERLQESIVIFQITKDELPEIILLADTIEDVTGSMGRRNV